MEKRISSVNTVCACRYLRACSTTQEPAFCPMCGRKIEQGSATVVVDDPFDLIAVKTHFDRFCEASPDKQKGTSRDLWHDAKKNCPVCRGNGCDKRGKPCWRCR